MKKVMKRGLMAVATLFLLGTSGCGGGSEASSQGITGTGAGGVVPTTPVPTTPVITSTMPVTTSTVPGTTNLASTSSLSLTSLNYQNPTSWFFRVNVSTASQNTPDAAGSTKSVERRYDSVNSVVAAWNEGSVPANQSKLHFNGSAWVNCGLNREDSNAARDSAGSATYSDCDSRFTGRTTRTVTQVIAGQTMAAVLTNVRSAGYTNLSIGDNSPNTLAAVLGAASFPAGSTLAFQSNTPLATAVNYYPGTSNYVKQFSPAVAAGGIASTQAAGTACNAAEFNGNGTDSTTLESLMAVATGTPCVFNSPTGFVYNGVTYTSPDATNESWSNSTVSLGTFGNFPVGTGATAPGFYSGNTRFRVAFKGPGINPVTYYACKERFNNGSARNCTSIGTGSYSIAMRGDARIMTFNNLPALTDGLSFERVFVERGGKIFFGVQDKLVVGNGVRINTVASAALLAQLALPAVNPDVPLALTRTSYAGEWEFFSTNSLQTTVIRLLTDGTTNCADVNNAAVPATTSASYACSLTFTDLAAGRFNATIGGGSTVFGSFNFLTGAVSGTFFNPGQTSSSTSVIGNRR